MVAREAKVIYFQNLLVVASVCRKNIFKLRDHR